MQPTENTVATPNPSAEPSPRQLVVDFTDGKLTVDATNASLNRLLDDIAAKVGMRVSGSVSDERVFGHYGPAAPSVILATLLDGTGSNMLLLDDPKGASELVLTPRVGGPTPPNPLAAAVERATDQQDERAGSRFAPNRPFQPGLGRGPLAIPSGVGPQAPGGIRGLQTAPPSEPDSSDAPQPSQDSKTPQQIYDQLQNQNQQKPTIQPPQQ